MSKPFSTVNWFGIPVSDLKRATAFYEGLLASPLQAIEMPDGSYLHAFTNDDGDLAGALDERGEDQQGGKGVRVFFHAGEDMDAIIARAEPAGGKVIEAKMDISPFGFVATIEDSEGNHICLHNMTG